MVFFHIDLVCLYFFFVFSCCLSLTFCDVFCRRAIAACFVIDLLRWVVVLPTVSFFKIFTLVVQMTKFDPTVISSNLIRQYVADMKS